LHENSTEFYYVVSGSGMFFMGEDWEHVRAGEAMKAPMNVRHGFKNNTNEPLILFSTFSPPIR
jgi:mannose-6-phosphate isomerase-like protein (cupin superfamily)